MYTWGFSNSMGSQVYGFGLYLSTHALSLSLSCLSTRALSLYLSCLSLSILPPYMHTLPLSSLFISISLSIVSIYCLFSHL